MTVHALTCPKCGAPVTFRAPFCSYCRTSLAFGGVPELSADSDPVRIFDLKEGILLPGLTASPIIEPKVGVGLTFTLAAASRLQRGVSPSMRDSITTITAVCHDPRGLFGVGARVHQLGTMSAAYRVYVRPAYRDFRVLRIAASDKAVFEHTVSDFQASREIQGVGAKNTLELRASDSVFHVLINGKTVKTFEDAHFCFGEHSWVVGAEAPDAKITLEHFEISALT